MHHIADGGLLISPTLLLVEVAGAVATLGVPLATWDLEQRERAAPVIDVFVPQEP